MKNTNEHKIPKLYGLVLAGGRSTRMGTDKGLIPYRGIPQQEYLYQLLGTICDTVFLSIREEQETALTNSFNTIIDKNEYRGPFNGILSAHSNYPEVAWLVLACDLPMIDKEALQLLSNSRNTNRLATSFATKETGLPEPLITIWEPAGLQKSISFLKTAKSSCPRKFLINSDIQLVHPEQDELLYNANSIEDYEFIKSKIALADGG
ncbi:NTP transferase domain-containing protein [Flagellimonas sp. HMM57]|uniref:NTP transferase domain-containing protein n=1 Tax=unclassified Flagellimonas TaxID=2644544 RepID=UPI0013D7BC57|nr:MULTISPECIES: NTP transferase domain-containing protein [unclassified Flagellimonas]UII75866.1 NTP transferase domain-containing protein [Flagellimonas sp. HMM57]